MCTSALTIGALYMWTPSRKAGHIPRVSTRFSLSVEDADGLRRNRTAEPVPRDQIIRCERGQRKKRCLCSSHHEHDWQAYSVDPSYSAETPDHGQIRRQLQIKKLFLIYGCNNRSFKLELYVCFVFCCLKKNQNAPRPSEQPPVRGKKCQNV